MARRNNHERQHETEYTFTRAYTDAVDDLYDACSVRVRCRLMTTSQKGVVRIELTAVSLRQGEENAIVSRIEGSYPDGRALTLGAKLFGLVNSLGQMVVSSREEQYRQSLARQ